MYIKKCLECGKEFDATKNHKQKRCSKRCYWNSITGTSKQHYCKQCGKPCRSFRKFCPACYDKYLTKHNRNISKKRYENHKYCYHANGYIMIKVTDHPYKNKRGYVYAHRLEYEKYLNRLLSPTEVIHHKDGNKTNNSIENLVYYKTTSDHTRFHMLERGRNGRQGKSNSSILV